MRHCNKFVIQPFDSRSSDKYRSFTWLLWQRPYHFSHLRHKTSLKRGCLHAIGTKLEKIYAKFSKQLIWLSPESIGFESSPRQIFFNDKHSNRCIFAEYHKRQNNKISIYEYVFPNPPILVVPKLIGRESLLRQTFCRKKSSNQCNFSNVIVNEKNWFHFLTGT